MKTDTMAQTLTELAKIEGFELIFDPRAAEHPDVLGLPQRDELCAQACAGNVIRMRPLDASFPEDAAFYAVSHEIAEVRTGFKGHTQLLWREQLNIACRWLRLLQEEL